MKKTAFINGVVYTADRNKPEADAFLVEDGSFSFVGKGSNLPEYDEAVDLNGKCVVPGFVDSHCHILSGIYQASMEMLEVDKETRPDELGGVLKKLIPDDPGSNDKAVAVTGIDLTVGSFSSDNIDCAISDRPVGVFSYDGHALLLNSRAMEILGIERKDDNPGLIKEVPAIMPCMELFNNSAGKDSPEVLKRFIDSYSSFGYTTVFDAMTTDNGDSDILPLLHAMDEENALNMRISTSFGYHGEDIIPASEAVDIMQDYRKRYSSENVFHDTLKLIPDGTIEEHSALLRIPYSDEKGGVGFTNMSFEDMKKASDLAAKEGFSVHIHAIGDEAVRQSLEVLTSLGEIKGTKTIAHNQLYTDEDIESIVAAGDIFFQTTPVWMEGDRFTLKCLGEKRYIRQFPVGTMVKRGVSVSFGSDVAFEEKAVNPFIGMYYACARGNKALMKDACLPPESEAIGRREALLAYTINGAAQLGLSHITGSITVGKSADFAVIDRDIINCSLEELKEARVIKTHFARMTYGKRQSKS